MHATRYIYRYVESHRQDFLAIRSCETITCAHAHLLRFHDNDHHHLTASKPLSSTNISGDRALNVGVSAKIWRI